MKKIFYFFVLVMAVCFASCQNEDVMSEVKTADPSDVSDGFRTMEEAMKIAQEIADSESNGSRANGISRKVKSACVVGGAHSRSESGDPLVYAVDYENNQGFSLIAASESIEPVLAVIDKGSYADPQNLTNDAYQMMLTKTVSYASAPQGPGYTPPVGPVPIEKTHEFDTTVVNKKTIPCVKVEWSQEWPENMYATNHIAGCVPVGIAQILSVFELPKSMTYNYPGALVKSESLNWQQIKKHSCSNSYQEPSSTWISNHYKSCSASETYHKMLARMVREIGHRIGAEYSTNGTGASYRYYAPVLQGLLSGRTYHSGNSCGALFSYLIYKDKSVAGVRGEEVYSDGSRGGHFWVADGAWTFGHRIRIHYRDPYVDSPTAGKWIWREWENTIVELIHYNWGWGGNCNGYFKVDILDTQDEYQYDHDSGNYGSHNLSSGFMFWHYE